MLIINVRSQFEIKIIFISKGSCYTVQPNDTLTKIAEKTGNNPNYLCDFNINFLKSCDDLYVGQ